MSENLESRRERGQPPSGIQAGTPWGTPSPYPLGSAHRGRFATVLSPFCADSATDDKGTWTRYSHNIASLVRPGALFLTAALRQSARHRVGSRYFPSADIDELDLRRVLAEDFARDTVRVLALDGPEQREQGYAGVLLARAREAR